MTTPEYRALDRLRVRLIVVTVPAFVFVLGAANDVRDHRTSWPWFTTAGAWLLLAGSWAWRRYRQERQRS